MARADERCPECGKTVREHIEEIKRAVDRMLARKVGK